MTSIEHAELLNELIIEIDTLSFDLRMLLARYVAERLSAMEGRSLDAALTLPVYESDNCHTLSAVGISLEEDTSTIVIQLTEGDHIFWDDLSIGAQDVVVQEIHHQYIASRLMGQRDEIEKH